MRTSVQEQQWVLRAQVGDRGALERLLCAVLPALRRYLAGLAGATDAEDLLQDVMLIVIRKIGSLDDPGLFRPWVFRIASREAFRHVRKRRLWIERLEDDVQLEPLASVEQRVEPEGLERLLASGGVSPASRAVLMLHFQEDLTLPEVAAILGIPLGTAKSRLAYGLASLRKQLNANGE